MIRVTPANGTIDLGRVGEHLAREVVLPLDGIASGVGKALLLHQRSGDPAPYPVETVKQGMSLIWPVTNADTGMFGYGQAEVRFLGEDGSVVKSQLYRTLTQQSLQEPGEAPEVYEGFVNAVARDAQTARDSAAESRALYQKVQEDLHNGCLVGDTGPQGPAGERGEKGEKGEKGDTGDPARLLTSSTAYMVSDSGTIIPSGNWQSSVPDVPQGKYLWTQVIQTYNTGSPVTSYFVSRMGLDGSGTVSTVNGIRPDSGGNVTITTDHISAGEESLTNALDGKQPTITASGLLKGDGTGTVTAAQKDVDYASMNYVNTRQLSSSVVLSASNWVDHLQTVAIACVTEDITKTDVIASPAPEDENYAAYMECGARLYAQKDGAVQFKCKDVPDMDLTVNLFVRLLTLDFGEIQGAAELYTGAYDVTPSDTGTTLPTAQKQLSNDVTVHPIPYFCVSNPAGGDTVYIAGEAEIDEQGV